MSYEKGLFARINGIRAKCLVFSVSNAAILFSSIVAAIKASQNGVPY